MTRIETVLDQIAPLHRALREHRIYGQLDSIADIRVFMEHHIFAVWDFMSLLKALQNGLTCTTLPWKPSPNARTARFINEIVLGEETDVDRNGVPASHFELYLESMQEVGADTRPIHDLLRKVETLTDVEHALRTTDLPAGVAPFLEHTFDLIREGQLHKIAAAFTFGRENLIPDMFIEIINQSGEDKRNFARLLYYLERHIEVDGDEHGPLAEAMILELCGDDERKWNDVGQVAAEALQHRLGLWDGIVSSLPAATATGR
ncbi:DUF3050 domain-containing protein [Lewinella sp. JB7]|uniref:DUF3050 domain-containing protein n=1 Tax=Lewinella sp. JB7 TaxID=2962887 RepID=UPI0020CA1B26|nr:DUF3050 domain-containing protein [Lewinella sp. JB7]MCP9235506.1 DUF3050 domain-containing protein [Lewinella sp. JB7]